MNKELKELLGKMNDDEKYAFLKGGGVRKRYPLILDVGQDLERVMSFSFKDTPKTLYRFLYFYQPNIDFSDMYKSTLAVIRIHEKGVVDLNLFKYVLAAYLYVTPDQIKPRERGAIEVVCGIPGVDNDVLIENSVVYKDFQIFRGLLEMEHDIYDGFIV